MQMPGPDQAVIERREAICRDLRELVAADCVIDSVEGRRAYDADGLSAYRQLPLAVVLPETVQQIAERVNISPTSISFSPRSRAIGRSNAEHIVCPIPSDTRHQHST